jgi:hypothetical protein
MGNSTRRRLTATDRIDFFQAVKEGKEILEQINRGELRLGELADKIEPKYGDRTMAKFAEALGIAECTLDRHRKTYRDWKPILAPGAKIAPYVVLRELASYADNPECQKLVQNPNTTKREALHLKRKLTGVAKEKAKKAEEDDWRKNNRRWFAKVVTLANEATDAAAFMHECTDEQLRRLVEVVEPEQLDYIRRGGKMLVDLADYLKAQLEVEEEEEREDHVAPTVKATVA